MRAVLAVFVLFVLTACGGPGTATISNARSDESGAVHVAPTGTQAASTYEDIVLSGAQDLEGKLWFGTTRGGLYQWDGQTMHHHNEANGFFSDQVLAIHPSLDAGIWMGTARGLANFDGRAFNHMPSFWEDAKDLQSQQMTASGEFARLQPHQIQSLVQDRRGVIWLGTCGGGAWRYDCKSLTSLFADGEQPIIQDVLEDADGNIWLASMSHGGVYRYDGSHLQQFTTRDGLAEDQVMACFQDSRGQMWFATHSRGVSRFDGKTFRSFTTQDGLGTNQVRSFHEDAQGRIWMGGDGGALVCYDPSSPGPEGAFRPFETADGQRLRDIHLILEDAQGQLWLGGRHGALWRYDGQDLQDFRLHQIRS